MRTLLIALIAVTVVAAGCKKRGSSAASVADAGGGGGQPAAKEVSGGGGGAVSAVRKAVQRTVALNDMHQLGTFIELQYNETGKMPNIQQIKENLSQAQNILALINNGTIILTGTTDHSGLWAYQEGSNTEPTGGIVLAGGVARRATRDEAQQLIGR